MLTITVDTSAAREVLEKFPELANRAIRQAMRSTVRTAKQEAIDLATRRYTANGSIIRSAIKTSSGGNRGELKASGARNPLEKFIVTPKGARLGRGRYLHAEVVRGQGGNLSKAFWHGGGVSERVGSERFPIRRLKSVSAPGMLAVEQVREPLMQVMNREVEVGFWRAIGL